MLLKQEILDGIVRGRILLVFRRWRRPTVRAGGTLRTRAGVLAIDGVDETGESQITEPQARQAAFSSRAALLLELQRARKGRIYRIRVRLAGADPRIALRHTAKLSKEDVAKISQRLARLDTSSRRGPWTREFLQLISNRPGVRAGDLAAAAGHDKEWFKAQIRKLKELGLTESLQPGYRLSPRGRAYVRRVARR
jgi:hypothetical protein